MRSILTARGNASSLRDAEGDDAVAGQGAVHGSAHAFDGKLAHRRAVKRDLEQTVCAVETGRMGDREVGQ